MTRPSLFLAALATAAALLSRPLVATVTWTNAANDAAWSNPLNWSTNLVPTIGDEVVFPSTVPNGATTVTLPVGAAAWIVTLNAPYTLTGGTLELRHLADEQPSFGQIRTFGSTPGNVDIQTQLVGHTRLNLVPSSGPMTLTLSADNTFTGGQVQFSGTSLRIIHDAAFGHPDNVAWFYAVPIVDASFSTGRPYQPGTSQSGINVTANHTFTLTNLLGSGANFDKFGPGTLALANPLKSHLPGNPVFPTSTTLFDGTLRLEHALALGQSTSEFHPIRVNSQATLELACPTFDARRIEFLSTGASLRASGDVVVSAPMRSDGYSVRFSGGILSTDSLTLLPSSLGPQFGASQIDVTGPGRVILDGPSGVPSNTNWNPTAGGTLQLNHPSSITPAAPSTPLLLTSGTLAASGIAVPFPINLRGGSIAPGDAPGTFAAAVTVDPAPSNPHSSIALSAPGAPSRDLTLSGKLTQNRSFFVHNPAGQPASLILTNPANTLPGNVGTLFVLGGATLTSAPTPKSGSALGQTPITLADATLKLLSNQSTSYPNAVRIGFTSNPGIPAALTPAASASTLFAGRYDDSAPPGPLTHTLASLNLMPAHTLTVATDPDTRLLVASLTIASTLTLATGASLAVAGPFPGTGTIDLQPNASLILSHSNTSRLNEARSRILSGQLASSAPDPGDALSLGYADAGPETLVRLTCTGDANLSGSIDPDDYALLDSAYAYQLPNPHWTNGDFDYNDTIDANDYLLIDRALYHQAQTFSPGFLSQRESQFGPAYVSQLLASIPEPSVAWLLVAPVLGQRRRCRS